MNADLDRARRGLCGNRSCDRAVRAGTMAVYCSSLCRAAARNDDGNMTFRVRLPMSAVHRMVADACTAGQDVHEYIADAVIDAVIDADLEGDLL